MTAETTLDTPADDGSRAEARRRLQRRLIFPAILALAAVLRAWDLGGLSFWYDEVVTMRLARSPGPAALVRLLSEIDAARAPLHPLLLQGWIAVFGASESAARALSVACGLATVALVAWIGRLAFDPPAGLWAAWLSAISPPLVYYAREARMYACLVMLSCLAWGLLLSLRASRSPFRMALFALSLAALLYTHPLGMLMAATLGLASFLFARTFFGTRPRWLLVHLAGLLPAAPWLPRYFDHDPEFLTGRLPIRFLLGTPIGFTGGNFLTLAGLALLIGFGLDRRWRASDADRDRSGPVCLLLWLLAPPALLFAYSCIGHPVFGPARYTLFVAPAFLVLVAQGLARMRPLLRWSVVLALALLASWEMGRKVYAPGLKADWRECAAMLSRELAAHPDVPHTVLVLSPGAGPHAEVETARYYLPEGCVVLDYGEATSKGNAALPDGMVYLASCSRRDRGSNPPPDLLRAPEGMSPEASFPGLSLDRIWGELRERPGAGRTPAAPGSPGPR